MTTIKKIVEEEPYYFICSECARTKGWRWEEGHCATAHEDRCLYCGEKATLTATTDWLKSGEKKLKIWD